MIMTDKNKFIPKIPETYQVSYLENQNLEQIKKSPLSPTARTKVVNRNGSNYISENQVGYGPCYRYFSNECNCNFKITATLVDRDGNSRSETIYPTSEQEVKNLEDRIELARGEWKGSYNDEFDPSDLARCALADKVNMVVFNCGPQRITVVENPSRVDLTITINGNRVH